MIVGQIPLELRAAEPRVVAGVLRANVQSNPLAIAVTHQVGSLRVGEVAIVCAVSAGHRGQAFRACRELVERVKAELPIWKHQTFTDGTDEWVGSA